ncbi:nucleoside/nucleotide kinase family protein [Streptomyces griseus]|uniref:hypothetical protein n=1 Tax=Streptomyces griseus TaxID=1911 RepID=UPI00381538B5
MIIWLNGPFGGGKTTMAAELRTALSGAVIADPEGVGGLLRDALRGHEPHVRDYQAPPGVP